MRTLLAYITARLLLWATGFHRPPAQLRMISVGTFVSYSPFDELIAALQIAMRRGLFMDFRRDGRFAGALNPRHVNYVVRHPRRRLFQ